MIQIFSNTLGKQEIDAVERIFRSKWVGKGVQCSEFEKEFASHLRADHALLTNNCTSAIYMALRAFGIGTGDEVIISTVNFVACAGAVVELGAVPVFADVDVRTLNILPGEIDRLKTAKTKAVILLHYGGHPCPMDDIYEACGRNVLIIEDSANSISSSYKGRMCGTLGDAGVFSFDSMKILVMVDGGVLVVRDPVIRRKAEALRYLGLTPKTTSGMDSLKEKKTRWWEYELDEVSGRFVSNDVLAAIGREQLKKLPSFITRRKQVWEYYQRELSSVPGMLCPPEPIKDTVGTYYLYWVQLEGKRDDLAVFLAENGVYTTFRYFPLHMVNKFMTGCRLPNAEAANETTLNLPLHQNLSDNEVEQICNLVKKFVR